MGQSNRSQAISKNRIQAADQSDRESFAEHVRRIHHDSSMCEVWQQGGRFWHRFA